jgi:hypothetical protein
MKRNASLIAASVVAVLVLHNPAHAQDNLPGNVASTTTGVVLSTLAPLAHIKGHHVNNIQFSAPASLGFIAVASGISLVHQTWRPNASPAEKAIVTFAGTGGVTLVLGGPAALVAGGVAAGTSLVVDAAEGLVPGNTGGDIAGKTGIVTIGGLGIGILGGIVSGAAAPAVLAAGACTALVAGTCYAISKVSAKAQEPVSWTPPPAPKPLYPEPTTHVDANGTTTERVPGPDGFTITQRTQNPDGTVTTTRWQEFGNPNNPMRTPPETAVSGTLPDGTPFIQWLQPDGSWRTNTYPQARNRPGGGNQGGGGGRTPGDVAMVPPGGQQPPDKPGQPPPMGGQPPQAPGAGTGSSPPAKDAGFQSHSLSQPFKPGGQCPKVVSNVAFGPLQTAFESCQWNDPKQGGRGGWVGCVTERDMNFVCKSSNAPPDCKCTQDWSGKVPPRDQLAKLAPGPGRAPWQLKEAEQAQYMRVTPAESRMAGLGPPPESSSNTPSANNPMGGLGPPPEPQKQNPPDGTPMGALGPPPDPQQHNPPAPAGSASATPQGSTPQGPIFIPVPVAPPNVGNRQPPNVCHAKPPNQPKSPPNDGHQKPPGSGTSAGTNPGTRISDTWDTQPKPGDTKTQPAGTAVMNSGTCHLDQSTGIRTCKDTQGRTCTTKASFCDPAKSAQAAPPPPSGPLKLKPQQGTQLAKLDEPKTAAAPTASIAACESKAPYLPWGGQGTASITVSGGKPCGVGWHDTGATILENITVSSPPAHGAVTPKSKNEVIFTPTPGYKGQDSFMLKMQERNGGRRATLTVRVTVTIR